MAQAMVKFCVCVLLLLMVVVVAEGAAKKPKKVKCKDKKLRIVQARLHCTAAPTALSATATAQKASFTSSCFSSYTSSPFYFHSLSSPPPSTSTTTPLPSPPPAPISTTPLPSPPPPTPISTTPIPSPPPLLHLSHHPQDQRESSARTSTTLTAMAWSSIVLVPVRINVRLTVSPAVLFAVNCNKPGAVCQDPRFIGGDGITFYFHGKKDRDFCLVSDSNLHINAHFIGKRNQNMKRDFTWVQSLGILFDTHQLFIGAKKTATWDDSVDRLALVFDGEPIFLPDEEGVKWQPEMSPEDVSVTRTQNTNAVEIEVEGNFMIKASVVPITAKESRVHNYDITAEDCFAHLDLSFKFYSLSGNVSGVLGQTYGSKYVSRVKMGVAMPILGGEKEFASSGIFTTDCAVARFSGRFPSGDDAYSLEKFEYANLNCVSGIDGRGVVCKR
ncbi:hypothetical protein CK203_068480 [Vitis vinifera]|uniref:Root cap n=1 Tax=Vitis vinifera TaxID=29760 RepID=A0A438F2Y7_VITVI|nr:hypothetical protein CK203_068480 [Vitis vinifera]